jgi:dTDP-4-amino-4,6-dideoxygalactose transaminase
MTIKFFNPAKEFKLHEKEYTKEWKRVRSNGDLILKKDLEAFEKNFAKFIGVKYAVGVNSGTDALLVALKALGVGPGDKILVPSHTFVATVQVVQQLGAIPVLYDMDSIFEVSEGVKGIIVAHIAGDICGDMRILKKIAKQEKMFIIEDSCQALGAVQYEKKAGSFGDIGCFSFYPAKVLGCPGDAGALVTNNKEVYDFAMEFRNHWKKDYSQWGINSRLDNVLAAELNIKLKRLPKTLKRREQIAKLYLKGIKAIEILPRNNKGRIWQDFIVKTPKRDELYDYLKKEGIETMKNQYPMPIKKCPLSKEYESQTLRLPINEVLTDNEVKYIIKKINNFYGY